MILIVDFGSQTCHLIGRRIREFGVPVEIVLPQNAVSCAKQLSPSGIILSGGPDSVYAKDALLIDKKIFEFGIPILGICYGLQVMGYLLDGKVTKGKKKEYGPATLQVIKKSSLFFKIPTSSKVWMSHFDEVITPPIGFEIIGSTKTIKVASFADEKNKMYGIQFHPEVQHTLHGSQILYNFVFDICQEKSVTKEIDIIGIVSDIKKMIGKGHAVCALSGGIDSTVAAVLAQKAISDKLTCLYVDNGLMRLNETEEVARIFKRHFNFKLEIIDARQEFLKQLKGVVDPEQKRKIIGETFIRVFEKNAKKIKAKYLIQGTIYPDVIESKGSTHADLIKTHHNVGGLPQKHGFTIVEPLRFLYKDEVREIAKRLKIPTSSITRHVFPGPGLAVRIVGPVTSKKLDILRRADAIVVDEIKKAGLYDDIWMAFAVFTGIKTTGIGGDERKYGETIAIRVIESLDTMTADWVRLPYDLLARISTRIVTEVFEVVRVVYDITTKPPATMEWE